MKSANKQKINEEKWGKELINAGYTVLPSIILERQKALGLDAMDINIIPHLVRHWWTAENLPYPSKRTIAECMRIDPSTVRKRIQKLEAASYIKRTERVGGSGERQTNAYDLSGLIEAAKPFAQESLQDRQQKKAESAARRKRNRPKLAMNKEGAGVA